MVIPTQSLASNGLFFNYTSSSKLVTDIKYFNTNYPLMEQKYKVCNDQFLTCTEYSANVEKMFDVCQDTVKGYSEITATLETNYMNASRAYNKCIKDTPSRFTWFSIGAVTAVLGIAGILLLAK